MQSLVVFYFLVLIWMFEDAIGKLYGFTNLMIYILIMCCCFAYAGLEYKGEPGLLDFVWLLVFFGGILFGIFAIVNVYGLMGGKVLLLWFIGYVLVCRMMSSIEES
jgi:hypothetical protein